MENKTSQLQCVLQPERSCQAIGEEVGHADIARLTRTHDRVHRFDHFVERRRGIIHVQLIKVNVIRIEAAQ
jgi:hypothetical protein